MSVEEMLDRLAVVVPDFVATIRSCVQQ